jgi:hypothetical protein
VSIDAARTYSREGRAVTTGERLDDEKKRFEAILAGLGGPIDTRRFLDQEKGKQLEADRRKAVDEATEAYARHRQAIVDDADALDKASAAAEQAGEAIRQTIDDLEALARVEAKEKASRNEQARGDYEARLLDAQGRSEEADDLRYAQQQRQEYQDATKAGLDLITLAALSFVQAAESAARAAEKARASSEAYEDLEVRGLRAKGQDAAADAREFANRQQREQDAAAKRAAEYATLLEKVLSGEAAKAAAYLAKLTDVQKDELRRFQEQQATAAAQAAGGGDQNTLLLQSRAPGNNQTITTDVGTRVSREAGDAMLDELTTSRIILREIEVSVRPLRQFQRTVNTALGSALSGNQAYTGAAFTN